ncbi:MAG TPA: hypothetical protein VFS23_15340 [Vicinamibacterales bacterium]|nr:hypothetical protein [Vicinamibacterales bacterium]
MTAAPSFAPPDAARFARLARVELSLGARIGHVLLALAASALTIVVASLWLTEPALPVRTSVSFAVLAIIGLGWTIFSVWVLTARRVMFAHQRVVAGRLAVTFCAAFTAGCVMLGLTTAAEAASPAAAMGSVLLIVALVIWRRAETSRAALLARRERLEKEIARK